MGDNAWLLIALNNYYSWIDTDRYDALKNELESWIRSLQDVDGGLIGGFNADGTEIGKITEGNIDAFNAVDGACRIRLHGCLVSLSTSKEG